LNHLIFTLITFLGAILAGFFGSLTGLGGGLLLIPLLTLVCDVDIHYAIGTSLISIIATSSGAAQSYIKDGLVNMRLAMFLGIPTTIGAISGAFLAAYISKTEISIIFGVVLFATSLFILFKNGSVFKEHPKDPIATKFKLNDSYKTLKGNIEYNVQSVPIGVILMVFAGMLSTLLGIGSGVLKVPALDNCMKLPYKVSTGTSTLMIGVTALAGVWLYIPRGYINPLITFPTVLGILLGSFIGAKLMPYIKTRNLKILFSIFAMAIAIKMVVNVL
jgi:uncharacterized membrane protein YfcA